MNLPDYGPVAAASSELQQAEKDAFAAAAANDAAQAALATAQQAAANLSQKLAIVDVKAQALAKAVADYDAAVQQLIQGPQQPPPPPPLGTVDAPGAQS